MVSGRELRRRFLWAVGLLSAADLLFLGLRVAITGSGRYWFVPENLALAWLSLGFAWLLVRNLKKQRWLSWQNLGLTALWLLFLPNTWYVLTDFIHVYPNGEISQLFDIILIWLMVLVGFILGITNLFIVQRQLLARRGQFYSWLFLEGVILLSSFAIYVGRDLRWNSWDIIANPSGLLFNVSDQIVDPFGSQRSLNITFLFFILINVTHAAFWILTYQPKHR